MVMPIKRNHHFVPAFHLANFTKKGSVDDKLWVFDTDTGNQWQAKPIKVAYERDLYRVEIPETRPDVIEDVFGDIENKAAPILREICKTQLIPTGDDYNWLMNYIALLAERTPARREVHEKPMEDMLKIMLDMIVSSPERFEAIRKEMGESGQEVSSVTYEELRKFAHDGKYSIKFDNVTHINNLMTAIDAILPPLANRRWSVAYAPPMFGDFICSDNPVSLHWTQLRDRGFWSSPGHGLLGTEVSVPISSRVMLLGRFDENLPLSGIVPSSRDLAIMNSNSGRYSNRFIYSKKKNFLWYKMDGNVGDVEDFISLIQSKNTNT